jgi:hypothetical protein
MIGVASNEDHCPAGISPHEVLRRCWMHLWDFLNSGMGGNDQGYVQEIMLISIRLQEMAHRSDILKRLPGEMNLTVGL